MVPYPTLNTLSPSLMERMTRAPTHCLPRTRSPLISQQMQSDRFPSLPGCSSREGFSSASSSGLDPASPQTMGEGPPETSDPRARLGLRAVQGEDLVAWAELT